MILNLLKKNGVHCLRAVIMFNLFTSAAYSHSPHDVIDSLDLSPDYSNDQTLFILTSDKLRKSMDGGGSWKLLVNGLDNKGILTDIAVSPTYKHDNTVFVSSDGNGVYRSNDGGQSWRNVKFGLSSNQVDILAIYSNYQEQKIVLASEISGGLYRTQDGGRLWNEVLNTDIKITAITYLSGEDKHRVLAGDINGNLYISNDTGKSWEPLAELGDVITSIAASPDIANDRTFFIGTRNTGLWKSVDGGKTLRRVGKENLEQVVSVTLSSNYVSDSTVLVSMWYQGVYISNDSGETWSNHNLGLSTDHQADSKKYFSPHFKDVKISNDYGKDKTVFLGGYDGLFKSEDGGVVWIQKETIPLSSIRRLGVSQVDNDQMTVGITTYGGGAYFTSDDGNSWIIGNKGLETTRLTDLVFSPNYIFDRTIFSGASDYLLKSIDNGHSWQRINLRRKTWRLWAYKILKRLGLKTLSEQLLKLPKKESAYPIHIALSPNYSKDSLIFFGTKQNGVYRSTESGHNPISIWNKDNKLTTDLVISPNFKNDGTLFAAIRATGVYKTKDSGKTWRLVNNGFKFIDSWQDKILHQLPVKDIQLAISPNYQNDKTVFAGTSEGLYKSINSGKDWSDIRNTAIGKNAYVVTLAVSPNYGKDQTLLVSIKGRGLFKSQDGGKTFSEIAHSLIEENHLLKKIEFAPSYESNAIIYGAFFDDFCISYDAGKSWKIISRPVRYENMRDTFRYNGTWNEKISDEHSALSVHYSDKAGAQAELNFIGTGIKWIGTTSNSQGIAKVYIDGEFLIEVDQYSDSKDVMVDAFSISDLDQGEHIIRVEVTGNKNPKSTGTRIEIDAFDIAR